MSQRYVHRGTRTRHTRARRSLVGADAALLRSWPAAARAPSGDRRALCGARRAAAGEGSADPSAFGDDGRPARSGWRWRRAPQSILLAQRARRRDALLWRRLLKSSVVETRCRLYTRALGCRAGITCYILQRLAVSRGHDVLPIPAPPVST